MNEIYSADQPSGFYAVDFDQDGDVDVLVLQSETIELYFMKI